MKSWAPIVVALIGLGTALVEARHAMEAEAYGSAKDAQTALLLEIITRGAPCGDG